MASDTDFVALYDELGLGPDCTLEQFKRAYRRRVGRLHPDLTGHPGDIARLQRLNRLYESALAFQRQHGRLPGALPMRGRDAETAPADMHADAPRPAAAPTPRAGTPHGAHPASGPGLAARAPRFRYGISAIAVAVAAGAMFWLNLEEAAEPAPTTTTGATRVERADGGNGRADTAGRIALGMDARQVLAIQGPPVNAYERRWDYGPSWIGFHCGRVVDWYSSPLRPLRVDSDSPAGGGGSQDRHGFCGPDSNHGELRIDGG